MTDKLFTSNGKPMQFNLIGFEHRQYFDHARKIEACGGKVSLPDQFNTEAMTIVNTDICYTPQFIQDSIDNDSLVDAQNYCLKNILESAIKNNNNKNPLDDELSSTTMGSEENNINDFDGRFIEDQCLEESPDLFDVENDTIDETDAEQNENVDDAMGEQSLLSNSSENEEVIPNSDDETIRKFKSYKNKDKLLNNRINSLTDDDDNNSSDQLRRTNKKRKTMRLSETNSKSNVDLSDEDEDEVRTPRKSSNEFEQSNEKKIVLMNRIVIPCSPPTSQDESEKATDIDKTCLKKRSVKNKNLLNKISIQNTQLKAGTRKKKLNNFITEDNPQQKAVSVNNIDRNLKMEYQEEARSSTDSNHSSDLHDNIENPGTLPRTGPINPYDMELLEDSFIDASLEVNPTTRQWLDSRKDIEKKMKVAIRDKARSHYETWEEVGMLWWLIKNKKFDQVGKYQTWEELINDGYLTHRTKKGLYNHFHRHVLQKLPLFNLPDNIRSVLLNNYRRT